MADNHGAEWKVLGGRDRLPTVIERFGIGRRAFAYADTEIQACRVWGRGFESLRPLQFCVKSLISLDLSELLTSFPTCGEEIW